MARTVTLLELYKARYEMYQAIAIEDWATKNEQEPSYPPGVRPSAEQVDSLEALENTWVRETTPSE